MSQILSATGSLFRDRDLFIHDGSQLRRFRISAPLQAIFFAIVLTLVAWASYATAQMVSGSGGTANLASLSAATEARAQAIEQRQRVIEAALSGHRIDPALVAQATSGELGSDGPLARVEQAQLEQAALVAQALDVRYQVTAAELKKLGLTTARVGSDSVGGPFEKVGNATFKQLFNSWKKLDQLQDGVIAIPSDKPVKSGAAFTSAFGVRSDPFRGGAAMHPGIDLSGASGTPIYATADAVVQRSEWANGYGNLVELNHGRGIQTRYGHLSRSMVRSGQRVKRGDLIALMGSTGRSTGSHLHYEVRIDGKAVNPIPFMQSNDYLLAVQRRAAAATQMAMGGPQDAAK
ncbi:MAG TPA: M23 family metallopeptidase [Sphingomicrobium sp.]